MVHLHDLQKSLHKLQDVLRKEKDEYTRDSAILRFELCFEQAWKTMRDYLKEEGVITNTPRETIKQAFKTGIIAYDTAWLDMIQERNIAIHVYTEPKADELYGKLPHYADLFDALVKACKRKTESEE
jgi:nucleotidyltransferase substrate binding protein (TIGR01987 family)